MLTSTIGTSTTCTLESSAGRCRPPVLRAPDPVKAGFAGLAGAASVGPADPADVADFVRRAGSGPGLDPWCDRAPAASAAAAPSSPAAAAPSPAERRDAPFPARAAALVRWSALACPGLAFAPVLGQHVLARDPALYRPVRPDFVRPDAARGRIGHPACSARSRSPCLPAA